MPFFVHYTQGFSVEQRHQTIFVSSFSTLVGTAISAVNLLNAQPAEATPSAHVMKDGVVLALATLLCFSPAAPIARVLGH